MKMTFYTPSYGVCDGFGAATFGFAGAEDEKASKKVIFSEDINGVMLCGTYKDCLDNIPDGNWQAGIVLLGNAGNENEFVRRLSKKLNIPIVGGGAAINPETQESGLISGKGEACVFLVDDDRYNFEITGKNIHHNILSKHKITYTGRFIDKIDGCEPKQWLCEQKEKLGLSKDDFEHLTLTDEHGINAHLSVVDGRIFSGRDLAEKMYLRYVAPDEVQNLMQEFYDDDNSVVFGCAGLKGILDHGLHSESIGLFMFGEICTIDGYSDFGNLMLSKIKITKK